MNEVYEKLAVFAPFMGVMLLFVMPAVISVVNRLKGTFENVLVPPWAWWLSSIVSSIAIAFYVSYLFQTVGLYVPPPGVTVGIGALTGLGSSGLIDLSKYVAGTKR